MKIRSLAPVASCVALLVAMSSTHLFASSSPSAAATPAATSSTIHATCTVSGAATPTGSVIISQAMVPAITGASLPLTLPASVTAAAEVNPGGTLHTQATITLDLAAVAEQILTTQVQPGVGAAGYPQLESTAWDVVTLSGATIGLVLPPDTAPSGTPSVGSSDGTSASASFSGNVIEVQLGTLVADTRAPADATQLTVSWDALDDGAPAPRELALTAGRVAFTAQVDVGVLFYGSPIVGGVNAPWSCNPDDPTAPLATTAVVSEPVSTAPSTTSATTGSSSSTTAPATTTPPSTTVWPSATTTPASACTVSGFDTYGGYLSITEKATGFFHTAQIGGRWWFVDPDGHPFFSQGVNHVSFAGTTDIHGVAAYEDAVTARYGTPPAWAVAEAARLRAWGYNTLGAWSDTDTFDDAMPYTLLLNLTSQDFSTGVMEDLWEPSWAQHVTSTVDAAAAAHRNDPELVGYWSDNELHWGPDWRPAHLFDEYLSRPASAAGKQALLGWLEHRYGSFAAFADDFTTTASSWADLAQPSTVSAWTSTGGQATRDDWVGQVAQQYFSTIADALRTADPNHLFLGPRMIAQTTGTPVLAVAAKYVDVASFNDYTIIPELTAPLHNADPTYLPVGDGLAAQEQVLHKPILVSEWGYRAADSGLPNTWPPLFPVLDTQAQRAAAYEHFVAGLLDTSWIVGQHFFEFADEPAAGRSDGENSNFGLVDQHDDPYAPVVDISKTMHDCAFARLADAVESPYTSTSAPPTSPSTHPSSTTGRTLASTAPASALPPARAIAAQPAYTG